MHNNLDDLNTRTKLPLIYIHKLTELCLSKSYFLYGKNIRLLENAGPIGLLLMVVLCESYLQHLECKAIAEVLTIEIQPKNIKTIYRRQYCFLYIKKKKQTLFQKY